MPPVEAVGKAHRICDCNLNMLPKLQLVAV